MQIRRKERPSLSEHVKIKRKDATFQSLTPVQLLVFFCKTILNVLLLLHILPHMLEVTHAFAVWIYLKRSDVDTSGVS